MYQHIGMRANMLTLVQLGCAMKYVTNLRGEHDLRAEHSGEPDLKFDIGWKTQQ